MNPFGLLILGTLGGVLWENKEKRQKIINLIGKTTKNTGKIIKEIMPKGGVSDVATTPVETVSTQTEYN